MWPSSPIAADILQIHKRFHADLSGKTGQIQTLNMLISSSIGSFGRFRASPNECKEPHVTLQRPRLLPIRLAVVVKLKFVRMRTQRQRGQFVVALVVDPCADEVVGKDAAFGQETVIVFQRPLTLLRARREPLVSEPIPRGSSRRYRNRVVRGDRSVSPPRRGRRSSSQ